jgi:hypothetical protein
MKKGEREFGGPPEPQGPSKPFGMGAEPDIMAYDEATT